MEKELQIVGFRIGNETYGVRIGSVREIVRVPEITSVPSAPDLVEGVINLRGKVIPVVDLRLKFGMGAADYTERTCIIVVEMANAAGPIQMGIVVDSVSEVLNIKRSEIEETPTFGANLSVDYILGMAKVGGGVKILLDIDKVLGGAEIPALEPAA